MRCRYGPLTAVLIAMAWLGVSAGCMGMPPITEQERNIRNNELTLRKLEPRAFVRAWGMPTYQHMEFMKERKKFWLLPIILVLLMLGTLIVLTQGSAVAPFVYTLF